MLASAEPDTTGLVLRWMIAAMFSAIVLTWTWRFIRSARRRRGRDRNGDR